MRKRPSPRIIGLVTLSILFNLQCSCSRRASLRLRVPTPGRATIHLLDVDPIELASTGAGEPKLRELARLMNARRQAAYSLGPDVFLFLDQSRPLWEPHVLMSAQTDAGGSAKLDDLKPGSYWLIAYIEAPEKEAFWARQVTVKDGDNEVVLERSNALYFE